MIIVIKHIDIEGPETLGAYLLDKGFELKTVAMENNDPFPEDLDNIEAVICLGGPMNVYEEQKYPFLAVEDDFLRRILQRQIPFFGLCLGSQLLAKACGAKVLKSPAKEVGFSDVRLTAAGQEDPLFRGVPADLRVYQWHEDMAELPSGAVLLATSQACPHQAWRIGPNAYGLQFHIEITADSIHTWSDRYFPDARQRDTEKPVMLDEYQRIKPEFDLTAAVVYDNFLALIKSVNRV